MNRRSLCYLFLVLLAIQATPTQAARYDLHLGKLVTTACPLSTGCAQDLFEGLMTELGLATSQVFLTPAETMGLSGFDFSLSGSIAPISKDSTYWDQATEGDPGSVLFIPHMHVRKGLPFSGELGANLTYLPESELFAFGAELKWALNEGFHYIPDLAVRISIQHLTGSKDFNLTSGGWDISISKAFGIGGAMALTPYAGYNMFFIHAVSHAILPVNPPSVEENKLAFAEMDWKDNYYGRFFIGCRFTSYIFQIAMEGVFSSEMNIFSFKLGFEY